MKKSISDRLKELLSYYNITQTDFCKKTYIPKSAMSMYISGERLPRQDRITDIAERFGISETWLLGYDVPMKKELSVESAQEDFELIYKISKLDKKRKDLIMYMIDGFLKEQEKEE